MKRALSPHDMEHPKKRHIAKETLKRKEKICGNGNNENDEKSTKTEHFINSFLRFRRVKGDITKQWCFMPFYDSSLSLKKVEYFINSAFLAHFNAGTYSISRHTHSFGGIDTIDSEQYEQHTREIIEGVLGELLPIISTMGGHTEQGISNGNGRACYDISHPLSDVSISSEHEVTLGKTRPQLTLQQNEEITKYTQILKFVCEGLKLDFYQNENRIEDIVRSKLCKYLEKDVGASSLTEDHIRFLYRAWFAMKEGMSEGYAKQYVTSLCEIAQKIALLDTQVSLPFIETVQVFQDMKDCVFRKAVYPDTPDFNMRETSGDDHDGDDDDEEEEEEEEGDDEEEKDNGGMDEENDDLEDEEEGEDEDSGMVDEVIREDDLGDNDGDGEDNGDRGENVGDQSDVKDSKNNGEDEEGIVIEDDGDEEWEDEEDEDDEWEDEDDEENASEQDTSMVSSLASINDAQHSPDDIIYTSIMPDIAVVERPGMLSSIGEMILMVECISSTDVSRTDVMMKAREQAVSALWLFPRMTVILVDVSSYCLISATRNDKTMEIGIEETGYIPLDDGKQLCTFKYLLLAIIALLKRGNTPSQIEIVK